MLQDTYQRYSVFFPDDVTEKGNDIVRHEGSYPTWFKFSKSGFAIDLTAGCAKNIRLNFDVLLHFYCIKYFGGHQSHIESIIYQTTSTKLTENTEQKKMLDNVVKKKKEVDSWDI